MHVPRTIYTLHKGNENSLELNTNYGNYNQSRVRPAFQDPDDKSEGLYPPLKGAETEAKDFILYPSYVKE